MTNFDVGKNGDRGTENAKESIPPITLEEEINTFLDKAINLKEMVN